MSMHVHSGHYSGDTQHFANCMSKDHPPESLLEAFRIPMYQPENTHGLKNHVAGGATSLLMQEVGAEEQ